MKVLITGASGFVGSHVARLLVAEGCEVYALVREG
ncbi:GDP-mannose 4,6-dehydratase, partial [Microcystis aeruginosa]